MATETGGGVIRCHIIYTGRVQGVCFRAISQELSRRRRVVGYVRNLPEGTVEMEVEGTSDEVKAYLADVAQEFSHNITDIRRTKLPPRGDETRFEISY